MPQCREVHWRLCACCSRYVTREFERKLPSGVCTGRLVMAAFEDLAAVRRAAAFTALNVYRTGDSVCVLYILVRLTRDIPDLTLAGQNQACRPPACRQHISRTYACRTQRTAKSICIPRSNIHDHSQRPAAGVTDRQPCGR